MLKTFIAFKFTLIACFLGSLCLSHAQSHGAAHDSKLINVQPPLQRELLHTIGQVKIHKEIQKVNFKERPELRAISILEIEIDSVTIGGKVGVYSDRGQISLIASKGCHVLGITSAHLLYDGNGQIYQLLTINNLKDVFVNVNGSETSKPLRLKEVIADRSIVKPDKSGLKNSSPGNKDLAVLVFEKHSSTCVNGKSASVLTTIGAAALRLNNVKNSRKNDGFEIVCHYNELNGSLGTESLHILEKNEFSIHRLHKKEDIIFHDGYTHDQCSGSPIIDKSSGKVVAIHKGYKKEKSGISYNIAIDFSGHASDLITYGLEKLRSGKFEYNTPGSFDYY